MKQILIIMLSVVLSHFSKAQTNTDAYEKAFEQLNCMLEGTCALSFKHAVFTVEAAYLDNNLDYEKYNRQIQFLASLSRQLTQSRELLYSFEDKEEVAKCASLFTVMTDTVPILIDTNLMAYHLPFSYDFNDIWGHKDWTNMFVTKLLDTRAGNCHSLPFLYKILAEETGTEAHLAVAPNHFYIKHQNKGSGWYNTELTSGMFTIDAWLMASGYIHLDAITNKLYMEALNEKQSIAICLIDLAKGFEKRFGTRDGSFMLKCCNTALNYYPHYINGLLLKADIKQKQFFDLMEKQHIQDPVDILQIPEAQQLYTEMEQLLAKIHDLGYRRMPEDMYLDWLVSLKEERNKYENKNITNFTNPQSN